jgi:predicted esterase
MLKQFIKTSLFQHRFYTMQKKLQSLQPAIISPKTKHKSTIIWLHGLGDSSDGFEMLMREIIPSDCKCVIPNAPIRPITLNDGYPMRAWYDILTALVDQEAQHVPSEKIILGGISSACMLIV